MRAIEQNLRCRCKGFSTNRQPHSGELSCPHRRKQRQRFGGVAEQRNLLSSCDRFECTNPADPPSIVRASSYACPKPWSLARARRAVLQNIRRVVGLGRRRAQRRQQRDDDKRPSFACSEHNCRPGRGARASTIRRLETSFRIIECRMWDNAALSEVSATQIGRNLFGRHNCRPFFMLRLGFVGRRSR